MSSLSQLLKLEVLLTKTQKETRKQRTINSLVFLKGLSLRVKPSSGFTAALEQDRAAKPGPKHPGRLETKCVSLCRCVAGVSLCVWRFDPALDVFEHSHNKRRGYSHSAEEHECVFVYFLCM